ncbi:MAG: hypothetical protein JXA18_10330 [Chitinispirillaceae bacterium]|nr:hypothetical protein [Chitinispirillaceae bacterium]
MSDTSKDIIRTHMSVFQDPLPLVEEPFACYAEKFGFTQDEVIELLRHYLSTGAIRRVAGVLKHDRSGFVVNAMVAMAIDAAQCDAAGAVLAQFPFITHCYRRTAYPDWPYTMYAMVHAKNKRQFNRYIKRIRSLISPKEIAVLRSIKEYKKTSFRPG